MRAMTASGVDDPLLVVLFEGVRRIPVAQRSALFALLREEFVEIIGLWQEYAATAAEQTIGPDEHPWSEQYQECLRRPEARVQGALQTLGVAGASDLDVSGLRQAQRAVAQGHRPADTARALVRQQEHRLSVVENYLDGIGE